MNFNFDFGTLPVDRQSANMPLFASVEGRVAPLGEDEAIFYDPATDRSHVMTHQVLESLNLCREFQPMDRHVQVVCETLPNMKGQQSAVRRVLDSLAARGLMISDDAFALRLGQAPASEPAAVAGLFVRACDRPAQLRALTDSMRGREASLAPAERLVVVDDSRDAAAVATQASALRDFSADWKQPVHHLTPSLWKDLVAEMVAELPEHAAVLDNLLQHDPRFRGRSGGGQGRNLITLLAAGSRYLLLDDDNLFPMHRHPEGRQELGLGESAWAVRTYPDHDSALQSGTADEDAVARHLELCGRQLGELIGEKGIRLGREQLRGMAPSLNPLLRADARVSMTVNGHRGGSCSAGINWLLLLDARSRAGYATSDERYLALRGDPAVWFGCAAFQPVNLAAFTPFAVDNSRLMPCTSPYGRGEDAVFNALAALADGAAVQLHVPWAVGHRPEHGRDRTALINRADMTDISQCISEFIGHVANDVYAADPAVRFALMAARLEDLAGGTDSAVVSYLREYLAYRRSTLVASLQAIDKAADDAPAALRSDIRSHIEANGRAILERGLPRFAGWPEDATPADCAANFRREALALAAGLRAWPEIWKLALARRESWLERARLRG